MGKYALLVGINEFHDTALGGLKAPAEDVRAFAGILRDAERGGFDSVVTSLDDDIETIRIKLSDLLENRRPKDTVLIYYSGHGICNTSGDLFLATSKTDANRPRLYSLAASEVRDIIHESRATQIIVILDCCHSGAFAEGIKGPSIPVTAQTFSAVDGPEGEYILMSCNAMQVSFDGIDSSLSRFTSWMIDGLRGKAAPASHIISLDDLYIYVSDCAKAAGAAMRPQRLVKRNTGILEIARNPAAANSLTGLFEELENMNWKTRLDAVTALKELCRQDQFRPAIRNAVAARIVVERDRDVSIALENLLLHLRASPKTEHNLPLEVVSTAPPSISPPASNSLNVSEPQASTRSAPVRSTPLQQSVSSLGKPQKDDHSRRAFQGWEAEVLTRAGLSGADLSTSATLILQGRAEAFRNGELLCLVAIGWALLLFVIFACAIAMKQGYGTTIVFGLLTGSISLMGLFRPVDVYAPPLSDETGSKIVKGVPVTRFLRKIYDTRQFRVACWILLSAAATSLTIGGIGMVDLAHTAS